MTEPFSVVPALLWQRIAFSPPTDAEFHPCAGGGSGDDDKGGGCARHFSQMTPSGRARFCSHAPGTFHADLEPREACPRTVKSGTAKNGTWGPSLSLPWCNRETAAVGVVSVDCLISESSLVHPAVFYTLISLAVGGRRVSHNGPGRAKIPRDMPVVEVEEVGVIGASQYVLGAGHFFNEVLPRLMHMDMVLPSHIPLLWNPGKVATAVIAELRAVGLFSSRRLIEAPSPGLLRARRMYTYASEYGSGHTPLVVYMSQVFVQSRLGIFFLEEGLPMKESIVLLHRGQRGKRGLANQNALLAALHAEFPYRQVDAFEPVISEELPWLAIARRVHQAAAILGPHGANLNNIAAARPNTVIVEFGYVGGMRMPSDYFCMARNLGMHYWMSPSLSGSYTSPMRADTNDVVRILKEATMRPPPPPPPAPTLTKRR